MVHFRYGNLLLSDVDNQETQSQINYQITSREPWYCKEVQHKMMFPPFLRLTPRLLLEAEWLNVSQCMQWGNSPLGVDLFCEASVLSGAGKTKPRRGAEHGLPRVVVAVIQKSLFNAGQI